MSSWFSWKGLAEMFMVARLPLLILLTVFALFLINSYYRDRAFIKSLTEDQIDPNDSPSQKTEKLTRFIRRTVVTKGNPKPYLLPIFSFLRPTAREVYLRGGNCAYKARLLINMLETQNIDATKIALYDDKGIPRHAVVGIDIENDQEMLVDAQFGMFFPRKEGGYYSAWDIQQNDSILRNRIDALVAEGEDGRKPRLSGYSYHKYMYISPRTINWEKSFITRAAYGLVRAVIGKKADRLKKPLLVESPQLMLLTGCGVFIVLLLLSYLPVGLRGG